MKRLGYSSFIYIGVLLLSVVSSALFVSCDDLNGNKQLENALNGVSTVFVDWDMNQSDVSKNMKGYVLENSDNDILVYKNANTSTIVSYTFDNGHLSASSMLFPADLIDVENLIDNDKYTYLGVVLNADVYVNKKENIIATVWREYDSKGEYSAIGYAPINSEK